MNYWSLVIFNDGTSSPQGTKWAITNRFENGDPAPNWRFPNIEEFTQDLARLRDASYNETDAWVTIPPVTPLPYQDRETGDWFFIRSAIFEDGTIMTAKTYQEIEALNSAGEMEPGHFEAFKYYVGGPWLTPKSKEKEEKYQASKA
jgi:hypothetical protein